MKDIEDLIREHDFLKGVDDAFISLIAGCGKNISFKAGDYILKEGGAADHFYLIRRGVAALESLMDQMVGGVGLRRGRKSQHTLTAGDFLGVSWLVPPYRWHFDARAVEPLQAVEFDAACLRGKCDENHDLGYELMMRFVPAIVKLLHAARLQSMDIYGAPRAGGEGGLG